MEASQMRLQQREHSTITVIKADNDALLAQQVGSLEHH